MSDLVLDAMARELRVKLLARGLDPTNPPTIAEKGHPPYVFAYAEYCRRGGTAYDNAEQMTWAMIERVKELT